jgi:hypothetical protein
LIAIAQVDDLDSACQEHQIKLMAKLMDGINEQRELGGGWREGWPGAMLLATTSVARSMSMMKGPS